MHHGQRKAREKRRLLGVAQNMTSAFGSRDTNK